MIKKQFKMKKWWRMHLFFWEAKQWPKFKKFPIFFLVGYFWPKLWEIIWRREYENKRVFTSWPLKYRFLSLNSLQIFSFEEAENIQNQFLNSRKTGEWYQLMLHVLSTVKQFPVNIYLFKVSNRNFRIRREICSKFTIKTPERHHWHCCGVFIVKFLNISHLYLVFLLLTLNTYECTGC